MLPARRPRTSGGHGARGVLVGVFVAPEVRARQHGVADAVLTRIDDARGQDAEKEVRTRLSETARDAWTG